MKKQVCTHVFLFSFLWGGFNSLIWVTDPSMPIVFMHSRMTYPISNFGISLSSADVPNYWLSSQTETKYILSQANHANHMFMANRAICCQAGNLFEDKFVCHKCIWGPIMANTNANLPKANRSHLCQHLIIVHMELRTNHAQANPYDVNGQSCHLWSNLFYSIIHMLLRTNHAQANTYDFMANLATRQILSTHFLEMCPNIFLRGTRLGGSKKWGGITHNSAGYLRLPARPPRA